MLLEHLGRVGWASSSLGGGGGGGGGVGGSHQGTPTYVATAAIAILKS